MRTARRLVKDEAGMTMALAIMMIVLLGVMGAGLITFASSDVNVVVEENKGQRAFEVADAGIGAAKVQLSSSVVRGEYYDDPLNVADNQWSAAQGGLTLNDLDGDGDPMDSVTVKIQYKPETADDPEHFLVVSEGTYGGAKRKIEAIFEGIVPDTGGNGTGIGHPVYYTPGNIKITHPDTNSAPVFLNQISMFSGQNILIQGDLTQADFTSDYGASNSGSYKNTTSREELCDWRTDVRYQQPCFPAGLDTWNTAPRQIASPGFAAENKICGLPLGTNVSIDSCLDPNATSIADGVRGFDRTTGPYDGLTGAPNANSRGQQLSFKRKEPQPDGTYARNDNDGTISFPFPPLVPKAEAFRDNAVSCFDFNLSTPTCPVPASGSSWGLDNNSSNRIVFIDAGNRTLKFNPGGTTSGIMVVWCGRLLQNSKFEGIILNLHGDSLPNDTAGSLPGDTSCPANSTQAATSADAPYGGPVGTYVNMGDTTGINGGVSCACWVYVDGGTDSVAGIELLPGSTATFRPAGKWSFQSSTIFFETPPPTSFALRNWRELYE